MMSKAKVAVCPACGFPLKIERFVDAWNPDAKTPEPREINRDLYCARCDTRWTACKGPSRLVEQPRIT